MLIKVIPQQIPQAWEIIKFAAVQADEIKAEHRQAYVNELLHALLSNKAQAWLRTDTDQKQVKSVVITRLLGDQTTGEKYLLLQSFYAFEAHDSVEWAENMRLAIEFANKEGCSFISFNSKNSRILELATMFGFKERFIRLDYSLGGV